MKWNTDSLLSDYRIGRAKQYEREQHRPPWQSDADRITFSSAFRRLKDKAQVFPLSSSDYVRTRLTHSIEVSAVGRSLGTWIGYFLLENGDIVKDDPTRPEEIGAIVAAANLAHDIGNPPFGHAGEEAIRSWCLNSDLGRELLESMGPIQRADFERYDGNAQGFRVLSRLQLYKQSGGMQLTAATLGAYSKYPAQSWSLDSKREYRRKSTAKYGFFQAEKKIFEELATRLDLLKRDEEPYCWVRHPLAFITEAADDICYRIVDLEDAHNQKLISRRKIRKILPKLLPPHLIDMVNREEKSDQMEVIRVVAIGWAIEKTVEEFKKNYDDIMKGRFDADLIAQTELSEGFEAIEDLKKRLVYRNERVLKIEVAGFSVISGLLDHFVKAANDFATTNGKGSNLSRKILDLVPAQFFTDRQSPSQDPYERLLEVVDFVSGMTDSYALNLFRSLTRIQLP
jgi:dGTPase